MARPSTFSLALGKAIVSAIRTMEIRDEAVKTVLFTVKLLLPPFSGVCGLCMQAPFFYFYAASFARCGVVRGARPSA